ncbi:MAG: SURF1 family protein [Ilumatobacteraceae bacterium]
MYKFLLTPKWIALHVACVVGIAVMVTAGFWQLGRYHDRQDFKAEVRSRSEAEPVPFESIAGQPPADIEWRAVEVTGTYVEGKDFEVVNVSQSGASGHDAVSGLLLADGTVLIVNRGFAPGAQVLPPAPAGEVTVIGRVRQSQKAGIGKPSDDGTQQLTQIRRVDLDALAPQFEQDVQPVFLDMLESAPAEPTLQPIAFPDLDGGPPHLSYTFQWFLFSIAVVIGWVLAVRNTLNERSGKPKKRKIPPIDDSYASGG